jgi:hypothetical protein
MSKRRSKSKVVRLRAQPVVEARRPDELLYRPHFDSIRLEIETAREAHPGANAGMEGLGFELFGDEQGFVYAARLELRPGEVVKVAPADAIDPAVELVRAGRRPGDLYLTAAPLRPLNPVNVWLAAPFGSAAIFAFEPMALEPTSRLADVVGGLELVQAVQGFTVGFSRTDGRLWLMLLEDFGRCQELDGATCTADSSAALVEAMNLLTLAYYRDPDDARFTRIANRVIAAFATADPASDGGRLTLEGLKEHYLSRLRIPRRMR